MNSGTGALLIQLASVVWTGLLLWLARRVRHLQDPKGWAIGEVIPLVWAWCALLHLNLAFACLQTHPLQLKAVELMAAGAALFVLPLTWLPGRARTWGAVTLVVCACLLAFADLPYLRYFGNIVPLSAWQTLPQVGQIRASILHLFHLADLSLWLTVVGALLFAAWFGVTSRAQPPRPPNAPMIRSLIIGACLIGGWPAAAALQRDFTASYRGGPMHGETIFDETFVVSERGIMNAHLLDWFRTTREWWVEGRLTADDWRRVEEFFAERQRRAPPPDAATGAAAGRSLILVQVESMQGWVVNTTVHGQEITPFLNRLQQDALYFPYVFDQTWGGRTSDAEFVVLNSLHALNHGAVAFRRPHNRFVALPWILRRQGYATLSAHAYRPSFWNRGVLHPRYGFERSLFQQELGQGEIIGWGLADGVFLQRIVPTLSELHRPFFAFLITLGLHHPYDGFPSRHKQLDLGDLEGTTVGNYLHSMHYIDAMLGEFVQALQTAGLWQGTVLAVYGDHDASLLNEPVMYQLIQTHCRPLGDAHPPWRSLQQQDPTGWNSYHTAVATLDTVPLFIAIPGSRLQGTVPTVGGHTDIGPTLLDLLGLRPPASFMGRSLMTDERSRAVVDRQVPGAMASSERFFVPDESGRGRPGNCLTFPSLQPLPSAACRDLARQAAHDVEISRMVVLCDAAADITAALDGDAFPSLR